MTVDTDKLKALALAMPPGKITPYVTATGGVVLLNGPFPTAQAKRIADFIAAAGEAVPELIAEVERLRARFEYIEEHATTQGGGKGFTITCFVPADHEDIGCGIDAAIESNSKAEKEQPHG